MSLINKIPKEFYKLFASKYREYYQRFLISIYEESGRSYSLLGLTERECCAIMNEWIAAETLDWSEEQFDEEGELLTRSNMAFVCLRHLEEWGWLRKDYDESLNSYVVSFPEYSQLFVELFQRLYSEDSTKERESVLAVYSYLYTYSADKEKNNEILKSALQTSQSLLRMLSNMQEGMRGYFDELSRQRSFLGIQEVLVNEINNSDSKKYAILTTTDSFYRYKEAVKELIDQNLSENEARRQQFLDQQVQLKTQMESEESVPVEYTPKYRRLERAVSLCEEAMDIIYRIEREFDAIERRYNKLIEQKTVFASRAAARIRYILMEGAAEEDQTVTLVNLLNRSNCQEEILTKLADRMHLTERFHVITERSLYRKRDSERGSFEPQAVVREEDQREDLDYFVLKPLYTGKEIAEFRRKNIKDGRFTATRDTVQSIEDLEKLFFVWQDATEIAENDQEISIGEELENEEGFRFSELTIKE
ncbi:Wadjet anti-phage system protein JetA family protein [Bariatricus sp. SGI.161]|uniref:Wadjet anti-phage system protein JetA family protein n=1 Tax=Bariatricus sp. SGI.161 TaxID=3420550 RepID=UPI003D025CE4